MGLAPLVEVHTYTSVLQYRREHDGVKLMGVV
jgi:hypothetical protein